MQQKTTQQFVSQCGRSKVYVDNDMPIGAFHDFLMEMKGLMVERMVKAHAEQVEQNDSMKRVVDEAQHDSCEETSCDSPQEA